MKRIRVLIADDHVMVREGLRQLLQTQSDIDVVGEAGDGIEAAEMARRYKPDVVLLDIAMPRMTGLEAVSLIRNALPDCRIVVLSMYEKEAYAHQVLQAGAHGYVLKGEPSTDMLEAIRAAASGGRLSAGIWSAAPRKCKKMVSRPCPTANDRYFFSSSKEIPRHKSPLSSV